MWPRLPPLVLLLLLLSALCSGQSTSKRPTSVINTTKASSKGTMGTSGTPGSSSVSTKTTVKSPPTIPTPPSFRKLTTNGTEAVRGNITVSRSISMNLTAAVGHNASALHETTQPVHENSVSTHEPPSTASDLPTGSRHDEHEDNSTDSSDGGGKRYVVLGKRGPFPYIVSIQYALDETVEHRCSGVIVHSQWILTASRCASFAKDFCGNVTVLARSNTSESVALKVVKTVFHEAAGDSSGVLGAYGLALLKVESPLEFNDSQKSIPIALPGSMPDGNLTLASWGRGEVGDPHATRFKLVKSEVCRDIGPQPQLPVDVLCASPNIGPISRCYYDIGGPLVLDGDRPQLVGLLTSWYLPCDTRKPAVFMRMSEYSAWVVGVTGKETVTSSTPPTLPWTTSPPAVSWTVPMTPAGGGAPAGKRPMTVSSALAPGKNSISNSGSSDTVESSRSFSTATCSVDSGHSAAQSETVSVGSAICLREVGALSLTFSLSYANASSGSSISSSNVNASCVDGVHTVQSLGWTVSSSDAAPFDVKAVSQMHLDAISGLLRQPALLYL